jgi:alpha-L-rhamnosidase
LTWAKGSYNSISGMIAVDWKLENGSFALTVEIPVNTSATVILPSGKKELIRMNEKSVPYKLINQEQQTENQTAIELGSGKYFFEVTGVQ